MALPALWVKQLGWVKQLSSRLPGRHSPFWPPSLPAQLANPLCPLNWPTLSAHPAQDEPDLPRILPEPHARPSLRHAPSDGLELQQWETATSSLLLEAEPDLPRITPSRLSPSAVAAGAAGTAAEAADSTAGAVAEAEAAERGGGSQPSPFDVAQPPDGLRQRQQRQPSSLAPGRPSPNGLPSEGQPDQKLTASAFGESLRGYRTDGLAFLLLLGLTAALGAGVGLQTDHHWLRIIWMSCLLGPFG